MPLTPAHDFAVRHQIGDYNVPLPVRDPNGSLHIGLGVLGVVRAQKAEDRRGRGFTEEGVRLVDASLVE